MSKSVSEEYNRFERLTGALLKVPRVEVNKREAEYKERSAKNPRKRGPKPKKAK